METDSILEKIKARKPPKGIHSELHSIVNELRTEFHETAKKGVGSFSYYLGLLKRVPLSEIYRIRAEMRQSRVDNPKKLFWWHIGRITKKKKD